MSPKVSSSDFKFKMFCSNRDNLFFKYCKDKKALLEGDFYSLGEMHCDAFVRKNQSELKENKSVEGIEDDR